MLWHFFTSCIWDFQLGLCFCASNISGNFQCYVFGVFLRSCFAFFGRCWALLKYWKLDRLKKSTLCWTVSYCAISKCLSLHSCKLFTLWQSIFDSIPFHVIWTDRVFKGIHVLLLFFLVFRIQIFLILKDAILEKVKMCCWVFSLVFCFGVFWGFLCFWVVLGGWVWVGVFFLVSQANWDKLGISLWLYLF